MCGVCGILHKGGAGAGPAPIGDYLVKMLGALSHRGTDSTGVTIAGQPKEQDLILRLRIESEHGDTLLQRVRQVVSEVGGEVVSHKWVDDYLRLSVQYGSRDEALPYHARPLRSGVRIGGRAESIADALVALDGVEVHSIGECSEVIKDVGTASDLQQRHNIGSLSGSHGIGHVRMATESRVDITHSHPFWACPYPDVTVVHNGQLTNYHKLKRAYEDQGYEFQTENDSELIAVYLADALSKGATLEEALRQSLSDLDGTFTFLISTKDGLGYAKDQWAAKPLVTMETDEYVAIASEEVALRSVFPEEQDLIEPQESEVMTWST